MVKFIPSPRIPGVLFFLFLIFPFTTEGQVSSNISVMDSLIAESVAAYENQNSDGEPVHLAINLPGEYSYFEAKILKAFKNKYGAINYGGKREGNFILYSLESVSVIYLPNEENSLFSQQKYKRKVNVRYKIVSAAGAGKDAGGELTHNDVITEDDLPELGNPVYPFTITPVPEENSWGYLLKPAIATAASAILVYLFYTVRNN
ncbi:MAG: hypothetical protein HUU54_06520 [Ignavibacteriaceae bacterium]|nr:hypothetical protein [Ignavibacteriaceae bacterium]